MATKGKLENSLTFMVNLNAQKFNQICIHINVNFDHGFKNLNCITM